MFFLQSFFSIVVYVTMIVHDEAQVLKFNELFYSDFQMHECGFFFMAARKKYDNTLEQSLGALDRRLITDNESILDILQKFDKSYYSQRSGALIEDRAKVYYGSLNPRCTKTAAAELSKQIIDDLINNNTKISPYHRLPSQYLTLVHQSCARKLYKGLDVDHKDFLPQILKMLQEFSVDPYCIIETFGGYHVILHHKSLSAVDTTECTCLTGQRCNHKMTLGEYIHRVVLKWKTDNGQQAVEFMKNPGSPIPGTFQGGFPVHFLI